MEEKKRSHWGDVLRLVVFLGIGVFFIYWFLLKLDDGQKAAVWQSFLEADYGWVAVCMVCSLLSHFVRALRWRLLFQPMGCTPSVGSTFGSVMVAYLGNLAFPRAGEVMRCATLRTSDGIPMEKSLGTVVTERLVDALAFGLIVVIGLLAMFGQAKDWLYDTLSARFDSLPNMAMIIGTLVVLAIVAFLFYKLLWKRLLHIKFFKKIDDMVRGMVDGVKSILHLGPRKTLMFIVYSVIIYTLYILGGLIIFQAFGETRGFGFDAAFVVYLFGSVGMTFSQGGIGVYPVLVQLALEIYGVGMEVGTACGWLLWGSQQAVVIVVGAAFLIYFSLKKRGVKRSEKYNSNQQQ
ncbi:MAG: flippase-like domain-containing protein [Bacteroidales bacterium]|nr:flippase-like domain-containing protein [Bacteroidales bacterium]